MNVVYPLVRRREVEISLSKHFCQKAKEEAPRGYTTDVGDRSGM